MKYIYMALFLTFLVNLIMLSIVGFFILYIKQTYGIIITRQSINQVSTWPLNSHNIEKNKHILIRILLDMPLIIKGNSIKKNNESKKIYIEAYKQHNSLYEPCKKLVGGSSIEQRNVLSSGIQNLSFPITSFRPSKYVRNFEKIRTLFIQEASTFSSENEAKNQLKTLFLNQRVFTGEKGLEKFSKYISGDLFGELNGHNNIDFKTEFWINFVDCSFEDFRSKFKAVVNKYNEFHNIKFTEINKMAQTHPHLSQMENNTCFVLSLLYMIKSNSMLLWLIEMYCTDDIYKQCLLQLLNKKDYEILTEEEFNVFTNISNKGNWEFKFNEQNDPVYLLERIFVDKCDLVNNQFYFSGELIVSKKGYINFDNIYPNIPKFHTFSCGSVIPIIELHISDVNFKYNIQDILWGTKLNDTVGKNGDTWYSIPLFLKSPVFLGIKINIGGFDQPEPIIYSKPSGKKNAKGEDILINAEGVLYNLLPYGDFVFQEQIFIRSLLHGETKYNLTGFLLYEISRNPNTIGGHYIPYYKSGGKWYCTYIDDRQTGPHVLPEFPLLFKYNKHYIITMFFYERV